MPLGDYLLGLALLGVTLSAAGGAAELVRRRRLSHLAGAPRALALAILATAGLVLAHLVPLGLGELSRATVVAAALLLPLAAWRVPAAPDARAPERYPPAVAGAGRWSQPAAVIAAALVGGLAAVSLLAFAERPIEAPDLVSFDLPIVAQWIQTGSAWQITELFPLQTHGTYPHNGHLVLLAAMLPFDNDAPARFAGYPFLGLAGLGAYGLARELRAPAATAALLAAALLAVPVVATTVEFAPLDAIGVGLFASGLCFLARAARTARTSDLVLAGAGLGLALGVKWYTATAVAAVLAVWALAALAAGRRPGAVARATALVAGVAALAGGFWLVRNWVETGDPLYPQSVGLLGWDAPRDSYRELVGFSLAHYLGDWQVWREYVLPDLRATLGIGGPLLAALGIAALVLVVRRRSEPGTAGALAMAACLPVLVALYLVTPYTGFGLEGAPELTSVNVRYAIPALVAAAAGAAWVVARAGRLRTGLEAALLLSTAQGVAAAAHDLGLRRWEVALAALLFLAAAVAARRLAGSRPATPPARPGRGARARLTAGVAVAAVGLIAVGAGLAQDGLNQRRYDTADPAFAWIAAHAPGGHRVALAGFWDFQGPSPAWPAFGPRLGNRVDYLGPLEDGRRGQHATRAEWERAARRGGFDLVLMALSPPPLPTPADEPHWARAAGWREVARSPRFVLYERGGSGRVAG